LLLLQCYQLGYDVGGYISIERLIEENKERYYETLEQSSVGWHEAKHDPWPYISYLLFIIKSAYKEFESRLGQIKSPRGAKTQMIEAAIGKFRGSFSLSQIESACPGVSRDMIRRTLRNLQQQGIIKCLGRGSGAEWRKGGNTLKRG
jgi:Fic family protein